MDTTLEGMLKIVLFCNLEIAIVIYFRSHLGRKFCSKSAFAV